MVKTIEIKVEVLDIDVDGRWYTINYQAHYNGETYTEEINEYHCHEEEDWLEELEGGYAVEKALQDFVEKYLG